MYTNYMEAMQWIEDTDVLEMIVDKFSSSVSNMHTENLRVWMVQSQCLVDLFLFFIFVIQ